MKVDTGETKFQNFNDFIIKSQKLIGKFEVERLMLKKSWGKRRVLTFEMTSPAHLHRQPVEHLCKSICSFSCSNANMSSTDRQ